MSPLFWTLGAFAAPLLAANLMARSNAARAERVAPQLGEVTPVPGGALHWTESGSGRPVVCIHGLTSNLRVFSYAMEPLLAPRFRVLCIDRPGSGYSHRDSAAEADFAEQARMIVALLDQLGIEEPILVGHSLGGAICLRMALDYPERIGGLALLAPATSAEEGPPPVFRALAIPSPVLRGLVANTVAGAFAPWAATHACNAVFAPEPAPSDFDDRGGGALSQRPSGFIAASEDLLAAGAGLTSLRSDLGGLRVGGGVLYGDQDKVLRPSLHGRAFAEVAPGLFYEEIACAGHMLPVTQPEACADFVSRIAEATSA